MNARAPRPTWTALRPAARRAAKTPADAVRLGTRRIAGHVLMLGGLGLVSLFTFVQAVARLFR